MPNVLLSARKLCVKGETNKFCPCRKKRSESLDADARQQGKQNEFK